MTAVLLLDSMQPGFLGPVSSLVPLGSLELLMTLIFHSLFHPWSTETTNLSSLSQGHNDERATCVLPPLFCTCAGLIDQSLKAPVKSALLTFPSWRV